MDLLIFQLKKNFGISEKEAENLFSDSCKRISRGENPTDVLFDLGVGAEFLSYFLD
jgi:hypothetical protein